MTEGGAAWEVGRAIDELVALLPADAPEALRRALGAYASGLAGAASAQAAQSTLFVAGQLATLIEQVAALRHDMADVQTLVREHVPRLAALEEHDAHRIPPGELRAALAKLDALRADVEALREEGQRRAAQIDRLLKVVGDDGDGSAASASA